MVCYVTVKDTAAYVMHSVYSYMIDDCGCIILESHGSRNNWPEEEAPHHVEKISSNSPIRPWAISCIVSLRGDFHGAT